AVDHQDVPLGVPPHHRILSGPHGVPLWVLTANAVFGNDHVRASLLRTRPYCPPGDILPGSPSVWGLDGVGTAAPDRLHPIPCCETCFWRPWRVSSAGSAR